jgi:valyl-tRNA synthetase
MSPAREVPDKPSLDGLEQKWSQRWLDDGTYRFDRSKSRDEIYSIDTPPPTVSGSLHSGHVFSYTHTDITARFWRMRGKEVFYPMGWDDNSLNVVRRVSVNYGVRYDATAPPVGDDFTPPGPNAKEKQPVNRATFVKLCEQLTTELEKAYYDLWSTLGFSVDWTQTYTTIGDRATRASQKAFLRNLERGEAYTAEAPTVWDVEYQTAVAQAEIEDRELAGAYHRLRFDDIEIETTRPELVPACVALVAHPDDERFKAHFGTTVRTPLFGVEVPIKAHELADPEKGSGIAMICTFGDMTDVTWWRELDLPVRTILGRDGRISETPPEGVPENEAWNELKGLHVKQAQKKIVELLRDSGDLVGDPRPITHPVKFWENGTRPLEIVTNRQWFIRNGGRDSSLRDALLERGSELRWHPDFMRVRYENWVNGLNGDWNITRQLPFGVPIPLWYPIADDGEVRWEDPIVPKDDQLPIDPSSDVPPGFEADQRDQPGGFTGDPNVMDTWATSSMSPQIVGGWADDPELFEKVYPYDLRPQAHDIIRTWLFYTVLRSHLEHGQLPWSNAAISGFVTDPDRKKLSKSKGNDPNDPVNLIKANSADAIRYWSAQGRTGMDMVLDVNQFKIGRRLAIKLLNASKFALSFDEPPADAAVDQPLDRAVLLRLADVVDEATKAFESYDYSRALDRVETFFWSFCDDYLELVKARAYEGSGSALLALSTALSAIQRLFAPFLVYTTEEAWSWWQEGSVHRAPWPLADELRQAAAGGDPAVLGDAAEVLGRIRKEKSDHKVSMRAPVERVTITAPAEQLDALRTVEHDLVAAASAAAVEYSDGAELSVAVVLQTDS